MPFRPQVNFPDNTGDSSDDLRDDQTGQPVYITKEAFYWALAGENKNFIDLLIAF